MADRFILFRINPYRPLFGGGLGFREPPSRTTYSRWSKRHRAQHCLWEFTDWTFADQMRRAMNKTNHSDLVYVGKAPKTIFSQPAHEKKLHASKGIEVLA